MTAPAAAADLLRREIANHDTQWSLGTFGAIAEFARDPDEPVDLIHSPELVSALRQMKASGHAAAVLPAWLASLDQSSTEIDEDGAGLHHDC
jgi:hypothetical protein